MGDIKNALAALEAAVPYVERSQEPHHLVSLRFKTVKHLCRLERFEEASDLLAQVRESVLDQGNELTLLRVVWLQARLDAGQGRVDEALNGFEQVRREFTAHDLPYDAALASLDEAVLYLKVGRAEEVLNLTLAMGWIFKAKGIAREALASLQLFVRAAKLKAATVDLAQSVIEEIERVRRSASHGEDEGRG